MKDELLRLAALCEQAEGPGRGLDGLIAQAQGWRHYFVQKDMWWRTPDGRSVADPLRYTASIDAALTLVPEGGMWSVACMEEGPVANMLWPRPDGAYLGNYLSVHAATPALALCVAALKARASMEQSQ